MSTAAQVRGALAAVFQSAAVQALTPNIYSFDVEEIAKVSSAHAALCHDPALDGQINFIQWNVNKGWAMKMSAKRMLGDFYFNVTYFLDAKEDFDGSHNNAVIDAFETIVQAILATVGTTFGGTVEAFEPQGAAPRMTLTTIDGRETWRGEYQFHGWMEEVWS